MMHGIDETHVRGRVCGISKFISSVDQLAYAAALEPVPFLTQLDLILNEKRPKVQKYFLCFLICLVNNNDIVK